MNTRDRDLDLVTDDRGAVMVMGIFMCSCLVGALWYLAGIGDAILYRERLQEAADAAAFGDAALRARGMHLLVLVNLIMALILGVRVALRTAKLITVIAAAVFAALGIVAPALFAASGAATAAASALQTAGSAVDPAIDVALTTLTTTEEVLARTIPVAAHAAVVRSVESGYAPVVTSAALIEIGDATTLPVEADDPKILCGNAGKALPKIGEWILGKVGIPGGEALSWVGDGMAEIAAADPEGFCGLESSGGSGSGANGKLGGATDAQFRKGAEKRCENLNGGENDRRSFEDKEKQWLDACIAVRVTCEGTDPATGEHLKLGRQTGQVRPTKEIDAFALERLRHERDQALRSLTDLVPRVLDFSLNPSRCIAWAIADEKIRHADQAQLLKQQQAQGGAAPSANNGSQSSSGGIASRRVVSSWHNGANEAQIIGAVRGDASRLRAAGQLVRIATVPKGTPKPVDSEAATMPAWAQAELFYDCGGAWSDCNKDQEAMWHFKWRARLRRVNQPTDSTLPRVASELGSPPPRVMPEAFADRLSQEALGSGGFNSNQALRIQLSKALENQTTRSQGVH